MEEEINIDLTNFPFTDVGLASFNASITTDAFSYNLSSAKDILPTDKWMPHCLSTRNSTLPFFTSSIALAISLVTVPVFGLGIRPRGRSEERRVGKEWRSR